MLDVQPEHVVRQVERLELAVHLVRVRVRVRVRARARARARV